MKITIDGRSILAASTFACQDDTKVINAVSVALISSTEAVVRATDGKCLWMEKVPIACDDFVEPVDLLIPKNVITPALFRTSKCSPNLEIRTDEDSKVSITSIKGITTTVPLRDGLYPDTHKCVPSQIKGAVAPRVSIENYGSIGRALKHLDLPLSLKGIACYTDANPEIPNGPLVFIPTSDFSFASREIIIIMSSLRTMNGDATPAIPDWALGMNQKTPQMAVPSTAAGPQVLGLDAW